MSYIYYNPQLMVTPGFRAQADLLTNLVAFWKLDDGTDAQGANDLTESGDVTYASGLVGNCGVFDGTAHLESTDTADLSMGDIDFAISLWAWFDSVASTPGLIGKGGGIFNLTEYAVFLNAAQFRFVVGNGGASDLVNANTPTVSTGAWYHCVAQHDATNNLLTIQVNNGTEYTQSYSGGSFDSASVFQLGRAPASGVRLTGKMDAVGLWKNRLLSAADVSALYASGAGHEPV